jgi:hypothetical protein
LTELRWYATIREKWARQDREIYTPLTQEQLKRAERNAQDMVLLNGPLGLSNKPKLREETWEKALREEVNKEIRRFPKVQHPYINGQWVSASGLPRYIEASLMGKTESRTMQDGFDPYQDRQRLSAQDSPYGATTTNHTQSQPCQWFRYVDNRPVCIQHRQCTSQQSNRKAIYRPPHFFMDLLSTREKQKVTMVMEAALEEQCRQMGQLHTFVGRYLATRFSSGSML